MYPYAFNHFHHSFRSRGPSRLLWFAFGAGTATWWMYHKRAHAAGQYYGHCYRAPVQAPPAPAFAPAPTALPAPPASLPPYDSQQVVPRSTYPAWGQRAQEEQWAAEKARMLALSQQATDTMAQISEATLDSVLTTVEGLKAKLAEHRAQREKTQSQLEEQIAREQAEPRRLV